MFSLNEDGRVKSLSVFSFSVMADRKQLQAEYRHLPYNSVMTSPWTTALWRHHGLGIS